jgi:hypothetical protein
MSALPEGECIITIDFKQNIKIRYAVEVNQDFYQVMERSVFGVLVSFKSGGVVTHKFVDYVSANTNHDTVAAVDCLSLLFSSDWFREQRFSKLGVWADCGGSFRSFAFVHFILIQLVVENHFKSTEVNFFCEYHGKSEVDGHFSRLSVSHEQMTRYPGPPIESTNDLIALWRLHFSTTTTDVIFYEYEHEPGKRKYPRLEFHRLKDYYFLKVNLFNFMTPPSHHHHYHSLLSHSQ